MVLMEKPERNTPEREEVGVDERIILKLILIGWKSVDWVYLAEDTQR